MMAKAIQSRGTRSHPRNHEEMASTSQTEGQDLTPGSSESGPKKISDADRLAYEIAYSRRLDGRLPIILARRALTSVNRRARIRRASKHPSLFSRVPTDWADQLHEIGICLIPDYVAPDLCDELRAEVDRLILTYPKAVQMASAGSDQRIFGAENGSRQIAAYANDPTLAASCQVWLGARSGIFFTMANRIEAIPSNLGSGAGWHRDSMTCQFKSILYLNDVDESNGPFQFIRGSHRTSALFHDTQTTQLPRSSAKFSEEHVQLILAEDPDRLLTATGAKGTLLIADTTGIHRGCTLKSGVRYALSNYYYPRTRRYVAVSSRFKPLLGPDVPVN